MDLPDLTPQYDDFEYGGKKYRLREPDAGAAAKFRNARQKALKLEGGQIAGFNEGVGDLEIVLVQGCLYILGSKDAETPAGADQVRKLPEKLVKRLYDRCFELCPDLSPSRSATVAELEKQIEELKKQVKDLKQEDSDPKGQQSTGGESST
jgi:hypothetical protein